MLMIVVMCIVIVFVAIFVNHVSDANFYDVDPAHYDPENKNVDPSK